MVCTTRHRLLTVGILFFQMGSNERLLVSQFLLGYIKARLLYRVRNSCPCLIWENSGFRCEGCAGDLDGCVVVIHEACTACSPPCCFEYRREPARTAPNAFESTKTSARA